MTAIYGKMQKVARQLRKSVKIVVAGIDIYTIFATMNKTYNVKISNLRGEIVDSHQNISLNAVMTILENQHSQSYPEPLWDGEWHELNSGHNIMIEKA